MASVVERHVEQKQNSRLKSKNIGMNTKPKKNKRIVQDMTTATQHVDNEYPFDKARFRIGEDGCNQRG